jgi:hypothetical protein
MHDGSYEEEKRQQELANNNTFFFKFVWLLTSLQGTRDAENKGKTKQNRKSKRVGGGCVTFAVHTSKGVARCSVVLIPAEPR